MVFDGYHRLSRAQRDAARGEVAGGWRMKSGNR